MKLLQDTLSVQLSCFILGGWAHANLVLSPAESERQMSRDIHWAGVCSSTVIEHFLELTPKVTKLLVSPTFLGK